MIHVTLANMSQVIKPCNRGVPRPLWILSRCRGYRHLHAPLVQWQNGGLQNRIQRFDSSTECQARYRRVQGVAVGWGRSPASRMRVGHMPQRPSGGSKSHCKADTDSKTLQQQERRVSFRTRCLLMYKAVSGGLKIRSIVGRYRQLGITDTFFGTKL